MTRTSRLLGILATLLIALCSGEVAAMNKCVIQGSVTYQHDPCPSNQARKRPTVEELNAQEKLKRAAAASGVAAAGSAAPERMASPTPAAVPGPAAGPGAAAATVSPGGGGGFRCDGRKYCSQMSSCAEAKYFLAHCPGVKMDGDGNGIPCEQQWCGH